MLFIRKRSGERVPFEKEKIEIAIEKAMNSSNGIFVEGQAKEIADEILREAEASDKELSIYDIEDKVYYKLIEKENPATARAYEGYKAIQTFKRETNTTDDEILGLLNQTNKEVIDENSNKNGVIASTQRDLIAGEVSKDIAKRKMIPSDLVEAHESGAIHIHDMDYFIQPIMNCFSGDTEIVTSEGVKRFNQLYSGQKIEVVDKTGKWRKATVKTYGFNKLQKITLKCSMGKPKTIRASYNHRWILQDGTITTNLQEGDVLAPLQPIEKTKIDNKMFTIGFLLGDGSDYIRKGKNEGVHIRLCGDKIKYKDNFLKEDYKESCRIDNDIILIKHGDAFKQRFLNGKVWKFLTKEQNYSLIEGLFAADGSSDRNSITTADVRVLEMLKELMCITGRYISNIKEIRNSTPYKKDRLLYQINYRTKQPHNGCWRVINIDRKDRHHYLQWCVEEPETNSFTLADGIVTGNCCLVNMKDMLDNGTVVNGKMIETPKSFQVACNVMTQIIAQIASNQYGGQSIDISCLGKYLRRSYEKNLNLCVEMIGDVETAQKMAQAMTKKDLQSGIQTIQYQINTLMTSNGQAPFVTLFMQVKDEDPYVEEVAQIIEEILLQRIQGIKNESGVYVTPAFPKLIYVLDENNIHEDSKYHYLTALAIRCTAKRMYPDYISAKKMRENYEGNVFSPMGCRAFLSPYKDENGNYKFDGRFNIGVCSINLPQIGILAQGDENKFFEILDKRLDLVKRVGILRYEHLKDVTSDVSPVHWQHGAIARLKRGESINKLLKGGYSTVTIGYIGIYEASMLITGVPHTDPKGFEFAMKIMDKLNEKKEEWTKETGLSFAVYGTPAESLTHRFNTIDRNRFGIIKDVTDKGYYTNSFHVDVRQHISAFEKFAFESKFQDKSQGGCISYVEIPNMSHNLEAIETIVKYIYDNIQYAEFNTKSDYCSKCGYDGEIKVNEKGQWECPQCHNTDKDTLTVIRRTCGYLGENFWNEGRTKEINDRVLHI